MSINQNPFKATNRFGDEKVVMDEIGWSDVATAPAATGNTGLLPRYEKLADGTVYLIDSAGRAEKVTSPAFREARRWYADPNGLDTNTGANEAPFLTAQAAVTATTQAGTTVLNEGTYAAVTMSVQNTALAGASGAYGSLSQIAGVTVSTASGTSNKISDLTITGNLERTGNAPLYVNNTTVSGNVTLAGTAYVEIRDSAIQDGSITQSGASTLFIEDSKLGTSTFSTANSVISLRNVTIDAGDKITIGAGVIYNLQDVTGEVVIDPAAVSVEQAVLAQGGTTAQAEGAVTSHFMQVRMHTPDTEASPTKVVTWDEVTGELEISTLASINTGAPVTVSDIPPTGTSIEGAIHLVTDDGLPTGTVIEQYIYDVDSGTWIEMNRNAKSMIQFGTAAPTGNGSWDGEEFLVTSTGTSTGTVTAQYVWDHQSEVWVLRPSGGGGGGTSAVWVDSTTSPTATGNTGTLPRFVNNTVDGSKWYIDSTGAAKKIEDGTACGTVYFNAATPSTATIFSQDNPPLVDDPSLRLLDCAVYVSAVDGSFWSSNGTTYATKTFSVPTERYTRTAATAGQTTYTLPSTPIGSTTFTGNRGIVHVTRNGVDISGGWSWVGAVGTYDPAFNYGCTLDAADRLQFHWEAY